MALSEPGNGESRVRNSRSKILSELCTERHQASKESDLTPRYQGAEIHQNLPHRELSHCGFAPGLCRAPASQRESGWYRVSDNSRPSWDGFLF